MIKFIIKLENANLQTGAVNKLMGNVGISSFPELIAKSDLEANPRKAKLNNVVKSIEDTLHSMPELFHFMSKGLLYAAQKVTPLDRSRYEIEVAKPTSEGVLDGGHNTLALGRFILEQTGYPEWNNVKRWEDLKVHWNRHIDTIRDKRKELPNVLIPIEILHPADGPSGIADFEDSILAISAARNNNAQLKETSKANAAGLYDELKSNIDKEIEVEIEWKEGEGGRIKAADIVSLSLIALASLPESDYPKIKLIKENPNIIFSSKGKCVEIYNDFMSQEGVTKAVMGDRTIEIIDERVKSALALIKDLPKLYDTIYLKFPDAYNSASPGFGRISSVRTVDPKKWANGDKKSYMRIPAKTKFYQTDSNYQYPEGYIYPLIVSLTELIEVNGNSVNWKKDPFSFVENKLEPILKTGYQSLIRGQDYDPAKVGKEKGVYQFVKSVYGMQL